MAKTKNAMRKILNLTPHAVVVLRNYLEPLVIPPSGQVARVAQRTVSVGTTPEGVTLVRSEYGAVEGLPDPVPCGRCDHSSGQVDGLPCRECGGTGISEESPLLLVSAIVRIAACRADVVSPGPLVRDTSGQPIGCRGLEVGQ